MHTISENTNASNAATWTPEKPAERTRGKTLRKPFLVDIDAAVVRKLGKNAAALYHALRRLADGKSGELRFRDRWYKAKAFDREAKMCERVRLSAMRELVAAGLVTFTRPRVRRTIGGRLRAVAGSFHYVVHRQPVPPENRQKMKDSSKLHLQNCIPGSLPEIQSQILSNPPMSAGSVLVLPLCENPLVAHNHHHHHPKLDEGDDMSARECSPSTPRPNPKDSADEKTTPKIPPALRAWMKAQILARASRPVKSRGAYLRVSYRAFLDDLGEEIELYLQAKAERFMVERMEKKGSVDYDSVHDLLVEEAQKHALPIGEWAEAGQLSEEFSVTREEPDSVYWRIYENAAKVLGLTNGE